MDMDGGFERRRDIMEISSGGAPRSQKPTFTPSFEP
jgi:hypothetical protein